MSDRADLWQEPEDLTPVLRAAGNGDPSAWRVLVDRYGRRLFALAKSRCRDDDVAEDITQSVFATVAAKIGSGEYQETGRFEAWLFRIAMNRVRDHIRRMKRRPEAAGGEMLTDAPAPAAVAREGGGPLGRLREAMEQLPEADREIVTLRHQGGLSFKQISAILDEPLGTLLARHHRALKKLKELLGESAERNDESQGVLS